MSASDESRRPENLLTVWADQLMETLAGAGVLDVVVSPGSRSTPFALAAVRCDGLRVHSVLDERAAAFFALGLARVTARPPVLLCTSGTAPAHYFPAVIEASEACLPLIVVSADRPFSLAGSGAPQTTDQTHLFGRHARGFSDLGDPAPGRPALRGLRRTVAGAVALALGPRPGPVHLDARADKPLEPCAAHSEAGRALAELAASLGRAAPARAVALALDDAALMEVAGRVRSAARPVCVAGPLGLTAVDRRALLAFLASRGIPLLAEATSQLRFTGSSARVGPVVGDAFDRWIGAPSAPAPDLVLEIGGVPTSGRYARWLEASGAELTRFVLGGARPRDPAGTADGTILGDLDAIVARLTTLVPGRTPDRAFAREIVAADARAFDAAERASTDASLSEGAALRVVVSSLPDGALLGLGNSLPIRHADRFVPGSVADVRVLSQRGVNGIDGWIAGAAGAAIGDASDGEGAAMAIVIGDVTFAHDVSSLSLARRVRTPLAIVVLDNGGGRIFEQLPVAETLDESARHAALFTTPPEIDIVAAATAFGVRHERVSDASALRDAMARALAQPGATVVVVDVPPHGAAEVERRVARALLEGTGA